MAVGNTRIMDRAVELRVDEGGAAIITVNRPEARNALNWAAQEQFAEAVEALHKAEDLRVVIITGAGDEAFVSGGDLKEMAQGKDPKSGERLTMIMGTALERLIRLHVPVIGAVNGDAVGGGCELLTACDLRIAAAGVTFNFAEVRMALCTGWGGAYRLVALLGLSRALNLLLSGRTFDAKEAYEIGFIHRIVDAEQDVLHAAFSWAKEMVILPKEALAAMKELAWSSTSMSREEVRRLEVERFVSLWQRPDHIEAITAFTEKRHPRFNQKS